MDSNLFSSWSFLPGSSVRELFGCFIRDLFRGENVTSIWDIKGSRMEEAGRWLFQIVFIFTSTWGR